MTTIEDTEFGTIYITRNNLTNNIRFRVSPNGYLRATVPKHMPIILLKRFVRSSRPRLREMLYDPKQVHAYSNGQRIGKNHTLLAVQGSQLSVRRHQQHIIATLPPGMTLSDLPVIRQVRDACITALRLEAKNYLPKRIQYIADTLGYTFQTVRFSHAGTRWGSCNSKGTISLNIALMKLPLDLIDYVLIHELCHTVEMNHSPSFWKEVEKGDPEYQVHRRQLRLETPSI